MITHLVLDGVLEGALGVGIDIIDTAEPALPQRVLSLDGGPVRSGAGRTVCVTAATPAGAAEFGPGDVLVLPGPSASSPELVERLLAHPDTTLAAELVRRAAASGATVAASCSATFVLAAAGVLDGAEATTTWWLAPELARRFPPVRVRADRMVVDGGAVLTAGAAFAHADLLLAILARLRGQDAARRVAGYLVLDARMSQSRYMALEHLRADDPVVRAVRRYVAAHLTRQLGLAELAAAASVSPRTLARRLHAVLGVTPTDFVHRLRVEHASALLTTTRNSVDAVAAAVGYADAAAFRRVYRRYTGETPSATRSRSPLR
ncbi:GlxA family transcriptional regulator [Nocardia bovistercoris]|uniref:Helix-turn-helix domain-containing protein n=1 Tax=Nocardia bovistercoris TaxID=2785916 RepID=A0A931ID45_9NOCA|nr:helix-turn-helix domain-containing protein [Nocardia bovistercoris]MBH0779219.1 helix-turn-helix domain-containing protein [Nocardia bovistercoris]